MANDPSELVAAPSVLTLGGVDYRLQPFRFRDISELHQVLKEFHPDPRVTALKSIDGIPIELAKHVYDKACEEAKNWPPSMDGPEMNAFLASPEGQTRIVYLAIRRSVAGFTLDQAMDLAERMSDEEMRRLMEIALPGGESGPKAPETPTDPGPA